MWIAVSMWGCVAEEAVEFSDLRAEQITADSAVIRFLTSVPTTCAVEWGTAPDDLPRVDVDPTMDQDNPFSIDHEVALFELEADTGYWWRGLAETPEGATFRSEVQSFTTLEADEALGVNVATAAMGSQVMGVSSNFGGAANDETWGADLAIDGQMATEWATDGDGDDAWIEIDLGQARTLVGFGYRSRKMPDGSSIIESVELQVDGATTLGPFEGADPDLAWTFAFTDPVVTTTVRVEAVQTTGGNAGVREIELYEAAR